ncbi:MAG: helix-turn-helix transcriptional regulator [Candidatus Thiodiazotropha sp.]|jgi:transcriptional regulator with XRE-family HTH domain
MQKKTLKKRGSATKQALNPTYVKIGKRIRQARRMAKITNSRELSLRLGWSGGRINNFELGISSPGPDETERLCKELNAEPAWVTYGVGSPRASAVYTTRYRNLMAAIDEAETKAELEALLESLKLTIDRLEKLRANPLKKIPDVMARRCEKYLSKPRGWLDETRIEETYCEPLPQDMRNLLQVYVKLSDKDKGKLYEMAKVLLGAVVEN